MINLVIALADLLEAEGRTLRRSTARIGWSLALTLLTMGLAGAGIGLCLWGLFQYLAASIDSAGAAFITGIVALLGAGGMAWAVRQISR